MIVENFADRIALKMKEIDSEIPVSQAVLSYSLKWSINFFGVIALVLGIGLILGRFHEAVIALVSFGTLRMFSGGHHLSTLGKCIVFTTVLLTFIMLTNLPNSVILILNCVSVTIILFFGAKEKMLRNSRLQPKVLPWFKLAAILIICSNFYFLSSVAAAAFFAQALLTITLKKEVART